MLAGRARVDVHQLVALIASVNPTGRNLSAREEAARYEEKARLQSELLRRFGELVLVEETAPGVVALTLAETGQHAAHCPVDALDEDVRSRVRLALDVGGGVHDPRAPVPSDRSSALDVRASGNGAGGVAEGKRALEEWDYERARRCFEDAARRRPDDAEAAVALLELLVEHLAQDVDAEEAAGRMSTTLQRNPTVRALRAIGAARRGRIAQALELVRDLEGARAIEAWALLGAGALERGDMPLARRSREALAAAAPAHPLLLAIDEHLASERDRERRIEEERLLEEECAGLEGDALARRARDLILRHGHSVVAVDLIARVEARRRSERARELLLRADEHEAAGDDDAAVAAWREAIAHGAEPEPLTARLAAAEARAAARSAARRGAEIVEAFLTDRESALARWLEADASARAAASASLDPEALASIELADLVARAGAGARPKSVARAALALREAGEAIAAGQAKLGERLLNEHARMLDSLPIAAELRARIAELDAIARRGAARRALEAAEEALLSGDLDVCRAQLARARAQDLAEADRERRSAIASRIESLERQRSFALAVTSREAASDWAGVIALAEAEQARARDEGDVEHLPEVQAHLDAAIANLHAAYRFVELTPEPWERFPLSLDRAYLRASGRLQIVLDPETLLVATGAAGWVVLRWIDIERSEVARIVRFCDPESSVRDGPLWVVCTPDGIAVATERGRIHTLSPDGSSLRGTVATRREVGWYERFVLVPETPWAWHEVGHGPPDVWIVDTRTGAHRRVLSEARYLCLARIEGRQYVVRGGDDRAVAQTVELFEPRGVSAGPRVVVPGVLELAEWSEEDSTLRVLSRPSAGEMCRLWRVDLQRGSIELIEELAVTGEIMGSGAITDHALFLIRREEGKDRLEAWPRDGSPEPRWAVTLPDLVIRSLGRGHDPIALVEQARGVCLVRLSPDEAPRIEEEEDRNLLRAPTLPMDQPVALTKGARARYDSKKRWAQEAPPDQLEQACVTILERSAYDADVAAALMAEVNDVDRHLAQKIQNTVADHGVDALAVLPWRARSATGPEQWSEVGRLADLHEESALAGDEDPEIVRFLVYLRAVLDLRRRGEVESPRAVWTALATVDDDIARASKEQLEWLHETHDTPGPWRAALDLVRRADQLVADGLEHQAFDLLDCQLVWSVNESQSIARLAQLAPCLDARDPHTRLRIVEVAAECVRRFGEIASPVVLAHPEAHYSDEKVAEIAARARAWLAAVR